MSSSEHIARGAEVTSLARLPSSPCLETNTEYLLDVERIKDCNFSTREASVWPSKSRELEKSIQTPDDLCVHQDGGLRAHTHREEGLQMVSTVV